MTLSRSALVAKIKAKLESVTHEIHDEITLINIRQFIKDNFQQTPAGEKNKTLLQRLNIFIKENFPESYAEDNINALFLWQLGQRRDEWLTPAIRDFQNNSTAMDNQNTEIHQTITTPQSGKIEIITKLEHAITTSVESALVELYAPQLRCQENKAAAMHGYVKNEPKPSEISSPQQEEFPVDQTV